MKRSRILIQREMKVKRVDRNANTIHILVFFKAKKSKRNKVPLSDVILRGVPEWQEVQVPYFRMYPYCSQNECGRVVTVNGFIKAVTLLVAGESRK